jgi:integrase
MAKRRGNHEGSIYPCQDGTWRAQVSIAGKRLSYTGTSHKECRDWIQRTRKQIESGLTYEGTQTTLAEFASGWLAQRKADLRPGSWALYDATIRQYLMPALGRFKLAELRSAHIQAFYDGLVKNETGPYVILSSRKVLGTILNQAVRLALIPSNPMKAAIPPKQPQTEMRILDEDQVQRFLLAVRQFYPDDLALYQLAITTGMRQSEMLGLKWSDLDWANGVLNVKRQYLRMPDGSSAYMPPKTKSGIRSIRLGQATLAILRAHRDNQYREFRQDQDVIFCGRPGVPLNRSILTKRYKRLLKEAGLPALRFHDLRHTAASMMLHKGVSVLVVCKRLGHAKASITLDIYGHLVPSMQELAAEVMDEITVPVSLPDLPLVAPQLHQESNTSL